MNSEGYCQQPQNRHNQRRSDSTGLHSSQSHARALIAALSDLERSSQRVSQLARQWATDLENGEQSPKTKPTPPPGWAAPIEPTPTPVHAHAATSAPAANTISPAPFPPKPPWWQDDKKVVRVIAIVGGIITALGISFLVALAIQAGYLGPAVRVTLTYILVPVLAGAALWTLRKQAPLAVTASLLVTSLAVALTNTYAATVVLEWWLPIVGLFIGLVFAGAAICAAKFGRSRATYIWSLALSLFYVGSIQLSLGSVEARASLIDIRALFGFVLLTVAVAIWWPLRRQFPVAQSTAVGNIGAFLIAFPATDGPFMTLLTALWFTVLQFIALLMSRITVIQKQPAIQLPRRTEYPDFWVAALSTGLVLSLLEPTNVLAWIIGLIAIGFAAATLFLQHSRGAAVGTLAFSAAVAPWAIYSLAQSSGLTDMWVTRAFWTLLPLAFVTVISTWLLSSLPYGMLAVQKQNDLSPSRRAVTHYAQISALVVAVWLTVLHIRVLYVLAQADAFASNTSEYFDNWLASVMVFLLLADIGIVAAAARHRVHQSFAIVGLGIASLPFLSLLMYFKVPFNVAHMTLSITWVVIAATLVLSPKFSAMKSRFATGLTIACLAIAKLIFFDMATLDGFVRALTFIVCGLLLLAMAVFGVKKQKSKV